MLDKDLRSLIEDHLREETPKGKGWVDPNTKEALRRAAERTGSLDTVLTAYATVLDETDKKVLRTAYQAMDWLKEFIEVTASDPTLFQFPVTISGKHSDTIVSVDLRYTKDNPSRYGPFEESVKEQEWRAIELVDLRKRGLLPVPLPILIQTLPYLREVYLNDEPSDLIVTGTYIQANSRGYTITHNPQIEDDGTLKRRTSGFPIPDRVFGSQKRTSSKNPHRRYSALIDLEEKKQEEIMQAYRNLQVYHDAEFEPSNKPAVVALRHRGKDEFRIEFLLDKNQLGRNGKYRVFGMRPGITTPNKEFNFTGLRSALEVFETIGVRQGGPQIRDYVVKARQLLNRIERIRSVYNNY